MKTVDVYRQYFAADCVFGGVQRRGVAVWLSAESDAGNIRYEVGVSFFPHADEQDFAVSYDACALKELENTRGRRSKKRDALAMQQLRSEADNLASSLGGMIDWERPLNEPQHG